MSSASILSITNLYDKEQKRKNRWYLTFNGLPTFTDGTNTETSINNYDYTFDPDALTSADIASDIASTTVKMVSDVSDLELALTSASRPSFNFEESENARLNEKYYYPTRINYEPIEVRFKDAIDLNVGRYVYGWSRAVYDYRTGAFGYKKSFTTTAELYMLTPKGAIVERWVLKNCWPNAVNFNDLSYEDTGAAEVSMTLRYDRAIPIFYKDDTTEVEYGLASHPFGVPTADGFTSTYFGFGNGAYTPPTP